MTLKKVHREAMMLAQEAIVFRELGNETEAISLFRKAFELEKEAALKLLTEFDAEPTRGILFRSAATLAMDCGEYREAEQLVNHGLAGNISDEMADELRDLYEDINMGRHLKLGEVELSSSEIQMSLSGNEVGYGIINSNEFIGRYKKFELLAFRTAERKAGKPYRTGGKTQSDIKDSFQTFLTVPRAASFAVTIRLGRSQGVQLDAFEGNVIQKVIDEIMEGIKLVNDGEEESLQERIKDENYLQNFISLTKAIAPDGDRVTQVGFTVKRGGQEVSLGLVRSRKDISGLVGNKEFEEDSFTVEGTLRVADANKNTVEIYESSGKRYKLDVPEGLNDIVKEYWDTEVFAFVSRKKRKYRLLSIESKD